MKNKIKSTSTLITFIFLYIVFLFIVTHISYQSEIERKEIEQCEELVRKNKAETEASDYRDKINMQQVYYDRYQQEEIEIITEPIETYLDDIPASTESQVETYYVAEGCLTPTEGVHYGPSGKESYYNLNMQNCVDIMKGNGFDYEYWIRDDGVKMFGPYVMIAANLDIRPKGTLVETSLGTGIVVDTGEFANYDITQIDIAVDW